MQNENNKTTTQDKNSITTTQGGSEQCKTKMNTTYKNNNTNKQAQHQKKTKTKTPSEEAKKPLGLIHCWYPW
jgi:hypothetical protein